MNQHIVFILNIYDKKIIVHYYQKLFNTCKIYILQIYILFQDMN